MFAYCYEKHTSLANHAAKLNMRLGNISSIFSANLNPQFPHNSNSGKMVHDIIACHLLFYIKTIKKEHGIILHSLHSSAIIMYISKYLTFFSTVKKKNR